MSMSEIVLSPLQEIVGILRKVEVHAGQINLTLDCNEITIPLSAWRIENSDAYIGQRIGVVRTDIPGKDYLVREIVADTALQNRESYRHLEIDGI